MNREDIIRIAHESHLDVYGLGTDYAKFADALERFAALVASAEREACAGIVVNEAFQYASPVWAFEIVNDIKARGQA